MLSFFMYPRRPDKQMTASQRMAVKAMLALAMVSVAEGAATANVTAILRSDSCRALGSILDDDVCQVVKNASGNFRRLSSDEGAISTNFTCAAEQYPEICAALHGSTWETLCCQTIKDNEDLLTKYDPVMFSEFSDLCQGHTICGSNSSSIPSPAPTKSGTQAMEEPINESDGGSGGSVLLIVLVAIVIVVAAYVGWTWLTAPKSMPPPLLNNVELDECGDPIDDPSNQSAGTLFPGSGVRQMRQIMAQQPSDAGFTQM